MGEHGEIRVVHRGGSKINFRQPVVTDDSKLLLCVSGECVRVFSTTTEECIHDLRGHTDLVTGVAIRPSNHLQAYSCSIDGTVRLWDFADGVLIKTFVAGSPIHGIYANENHLGVIFLLVPCTSDKKQAADKFQLVAVNMPQTADQLVESLELSSVLEDVSSDPAAIHFGQGGEYIAFVKGLVLTVFFFRKQKSYRFYLKLSNTKGGQNTFTCVSCHPKDDCIATGHKDGKIRLWRNFTQSKEYTYRTMHWHHGPVNSLCFTPEGTNLLSGGVESVLVQWRFNQENQKDFLPRLGAAITHIAVSPDGSLVCTSHADNKITIIKSVKVSAVIQGLVKGDSLSTELMVDPRSKALVLNGKPGHLQFYSLQRDKLLYNLDIVQQEYIHESGLKQFEVVQAAFDHSGNFLATVEERKQDDAELELEMNLKLWSYDEQTQSFVLDTTISAPHDAQITSMCFCEATDSLTPVLVTTSKDGHFKAWQRSSPAHTEDEGPSWSCDFVGSYHGLVPHRCRFSADGSLLAVGFQEVVTLWSPSSWELLTTLSQPPGAIRDLCFGRLSCSKFLVGTTEKNLLCCWNLLTCSLEWSTAMDVSLLLVDPSSDNMAAFCCQNQSTDLFVFKPSEPRPLFSHKAVCSGKVTRAVFAPRVEMLESCEETSQWLNRSQLYFLTQHMELMTFSTSTEDERLMASSKELTINDSIAMTPFRLLLGKHRQEQQEDQDAPSRTWPERRLPQASEAIKELMHTPAHVLPSNSSLCSVFLKSLLISVPDSSKGEAPEEDMESAKEEEDSEEEVESSVSRSRSLAGQGAREEPALTKAELRELRRVRKLDFSWFGSIFDS